MTYEEAHVRAVKAYFKGSEPQNFYKQQAKRPKYTKKYFDAFEKETFGSSSDWNSLMKKGSK